MDAAGVRVSIRSLCDSRAIVYRMTATQDEFGDTTQTWAALPAPEGLNCRPNQAWSGSLQDPGPGQVGGPMRQWYLVPEFDCRESDVLKVTDGPEAGALLLVEQVTRPTAPVTVHHLEANVRPWTGSLT